MKVCLQGDVCKSSPEFLWVSKAILQLVDPKYVLFIWRKESLGFMLSIKIQYSYTDIKSFGSKWIVILANNVLKLTNSLLVSESLFAYHARSQWLASFKPGIL